MTRVDALTIKVLDGGLTAAEVAELDSLLRDPAARRAHLALLDTARSLRAAAEPGDLSVRVMEHVQGAVDGQIREGVRRRIAPRRAWLPWAAALLVAAGVAYYAAQGPAVVALLDGTRKIRDGEALQVAKAAVLTFPDGSVLRLGEGTSIGAIHAGEVLLAAGRVEAEIRPQAGREFGVSTSHARAEVLGTRFRLEAAGSKAWLEVTEGKVRLLRLSDRASTLVTAGEGAEVDPAGPAPAALRLPVARWAFDGDGADAAAQVEGAIAVAGRRGGGLRCGTGGFSAPDVAFADAWTISLWLRHESIGQEVCAYLTTGPRPGDLILERVGTLDPTRFRVKLAERNLDVTLPVRAGRWFQLALAWDGKELRLSHDGAEAGRWPLPANPAPRPGLRIGASAVPGPFDVDEVRLYDRALNPE